MKQKTGVRQVMTASEVSARVRELAPQFLEGLTPAEVAAVFTGATVRRLRANSVIAREGESAHEVFLILDGLARHFTMTREGEKVVVMWVRPGEIIGGRALLLKKSMNYLVSTETVHDSLALVWERSAIVALTRNHPRLLENVLWIASDYLAAYRDLHIVTTYSKASERVEWVLEKLAREIGRKTAGGIEIEIRNEELANESNVTLFTVSRLLSTWERRGLLVKSRGRVVIRSLEALHRSAD